MLEEVECESLPESRWIGRCPRCLVTVHLSSFDCWRHVGFNSIYKANQSADTLFQYSTMVETKFQSSKQPLQSFRILMLDGAARIASTHNNATNQPKSSIEVV
jgi:putative SOS response-associated peptidase YedK